MKKNKQPLWKIESRRGRVPNRYRMILNLFFILMAISLLAKSQIPFIYIVLGGFAFFALLFTISKIIPKRSKEEILIYVDSLTYVSKDKEISIDFSEIAYIEQDVILNKKKRPVYLTVELLSESEEVLLLINGTKFPATMLHQLIQRIIKVNEY